MNRIKSAEDFDNMSDLDQAKSALRGAQSIINSQDAHIESLTSENERLREAKSLSDYSIKQLRDGIEDIPNDKRVSYVREMCHMALSPNEIPSGGEPKKRCLTDLGYRTPLPDSLLSDDGERYP